MGYPLGTLPYFLNLIFNVMIVIFHVVLCGCFSHVGDDCIHFMWIVYIVPIGESPSNIIAVQINQSATAAHFFHLKGKSAHLAHAETLPITTLTWAFENISKLSFSGGLCSHLHAHKINIFKLLLMEQLRESSVETTMRYLI